MLASLFLAAVAAPSGDSATAAQISAPTATPQHGVAELALFVPEHLSLFDEDGSRPHLLHPFVDAALSAEFVHAESGARSAPNGFYDGAGTFRVRFSPPLTGRWTWATHSAVEQLAGHSGELVVAASKNPGCPKTSPGKMGFVYPDGSAYTPVGTTCYSWVHQDENGAEGDPDALEQNTLEHLKNSPFNKVRMTGFPKWCVRTRASSCRCAQASRRVSGLTAQASRRVLRRYPFTHHEPRYYPFLGKLAPAAAPCHPPWNTTCGKSEWDFTRFNPQFWQHFDQRVSEVAALGIVPEIILFHPYDDDHWGFDRINRRCGAAGSTSAQFCKGEELDCLWCDENYIKYMVSRVSAYGTWWSMANEWDLVSAATAGLCSSCYRPLTPTVAANRRRARPCRIGTSSSRRCRPLTPPTIASAPSTTASSTTITRGPGSRT